MTNIVQFNSLICREEELSSLPGTSSGKPIIAVKNLNSNSDEVIDPLIQLRKEMQNGLKGVHDKIDELGDNQVKMNESQEAMHGKLDNISAIMSQVSSGMQEMTRCLDYDIAPALAKLPLVCSANESGMMLQKLESLGNCINEQSNKLTSLMGTQLTAEDVKATVEDMTKSVLHYMGEIMSSCEAKVGGQLEASYASILSKFDNVHTLVSNFQSDSEARQD